MPFNSTGLMLWELRSRRRAERYVPTEVAAIPCCSDSWPRDIDADRHGCIFVLFEGCWCNNDKKNIVKHVHGPCECHRLGMDPLPDHPGAGYGLLHRLRHLVQINRCIGEVQSGDNSLHFLPHGYHGHLYFGASWCLSCLQYEKCQWYLPGV